MRGSLIVTYLDDIEVGSDYLNIAVNGVTKKRIYNNSTGLYAVPLLVGDVVTLTYVPIGGFEINFSLSRVDYTTDDVNGDFGIKTTSIVNGGTLYSYTFTVSTISTAYDFEYIYTSAVQSNYQIWTEDDEPIMTELNQFINQEY